MRDGVHHLHDDHHLRRHEPRDLLHLVRADRHARAAAARARPAAAAPTQRQRRVPARHSPAGPRQRAGHRRRPLRHYLVRHQPRRLLGLWHGPAEHGLGLEDPSFLLQPQRLRHHLGPCGRRHGRRLHAVPVPPAAAAHPRGPVHRERAGCAVGRHADGRQRERDVPERFGAGGCAADRHDRVLRRLQHRRRRPRRDQVEQRHLDLLVPAVLGGLHQRPVPRAPGRLVARLLREGAQRDAAAQLVRLYRAHGNRGLRFRWLVPPDELVPGPDGRRPHRHGGADPHRRRAEPRRPRQHAPHPHQHGQRADPRSALLRQRRHNEGRQDRRPRRPRRPAHPQRAPALRRQDQQEPGLHHRQRAQGARDGHQPAVREGHAALHAVQLRHHGRGRALRHHPLGQLRLRRAGTVPGHAQLPHRQPAALLRPVQRHLLGNQGRQPEPLPRLQVRQLAQLCPGHPRRPGRRDGGAAHVHHACREHEPGDRERGGRGDHQRGVHRGDPAARGRLPRTFGHLLLRSRPRLHHARRHQPAPHLGRGLQERHRQVRRPLDQPEPVPRGQHPRRGGLPRRHDAGVHGAGAVVRGADKRGRVPPRAADAGREDRTRVLRDRDRALLHVQVRRYGPRALQVLHRRADPLQRGRQLHHGHPQRDRDHRLRQGLPHLEHQPHEQQRLDPRRHRDAAPRHAVRHPLRRLVQHGQPRARGQDVRAAARDHKHQRRAGAAQLRHRAGRQAGVQDGGLPAFQGQDRVMRRGGRLGWLTCSVSNEKL